MDLSLLHIFRYPDEIKALFKIRVKHKVYQPEKASLELLAEQMDDLGFCYAVLGKVSRSFSVVIQQLPEELKDPVCIFYLVLRALDSIEDDTNTPAATRKQLLENFFLVHHNPNWKISGVGDTAEYRLLLENYPKVIASFSSLEEKYQNVILEICREMGEGMGRFLDEELETLEDYDTYCYYVAGLVGIGLSRLFVESGIEDEVLLENERLSVEMGVFLQKTNIIRDYFEDIEAGRTFWPKEIWGRYHSRPDGFVFSETDAARHCLNHLITDALRHAKESLQYLRKINNPLVFKFCAIPQVMAMATLNEIYNNPNVFRKNVKIRKGLAAKLILETSTYSDVYRIFVQFARRIFSKVSLEDNNSSKTVAALNSIIAAKENHENRKKPPVLAGA